MKRDFKASIETRFGCAENSPDSSFHAINPPGLTLNNNMENVKSLKHSN